MATRRIVYPGAVDADGHILEPPDLWEQYLEPRYRDRALRLRTDDEGLEYLEINGAPSKLTRRGSPGMLGGMGKRSEQIAPNPQRTYLRSAPFGSMNATERLQLLDAEGLEGAFLYPTIELLWEAECDDVEISQAYCRAYNRWIADFCRDSGGRLIPIAHLSLGDPVAAAHELARAVKDGCRGAWVAPFAITKKPHGHPDHDALFAAAQDLDVPLGIHPTFEPRHAFSGRFDMQYIRRAQFYLNMLAGEGVRHAFTTLFQFGVFDRFPRLKIIILESGAGWIGYWLDRMDAIAKVPNAALPLTHKPSDYFRRQCWISADPEESTIPALMDLVGADRFFWASDYPHPDHTGDYIAELEDLAGKLAPSARAQLLGENVRRCYGMAV
ncbi:MAG: amidohydrolase [Deltaproteobacteria bacterium]|nr:amidohydrolase [Deltaproteobacteria bacterium]MBI3386208.1 amidohydrolase [Deltaproteobacteria bacterium]